MAFDNDAAVPGRVIAAGVPCWVVKPLTGDGGQSRALAETAERQGVPLWVDYHKRFDVSNRVARSATLEGRHFLDFTLAPAEEQSRALANDSLPWAREAARVDEILDLVDDALA